MMLLAKASGQLEAVLKALVACALELSQSVLNGCQCRHCSYTWGKHCRFYSPGWAIGRHQAIPIPSHLGHWRPGWASLD